MTRGALYHYFESKPAVVEDLTERLVDDSERVLAQIVEEPELGATEKLQRFFGEIVRWKSERQNLMVAMLPVWYAPDNISFRLLVDCATAARLAPLLGAIVRQGVDEHRFATAYPEHAGSIIVAVVQALQDAIAQQLLTGTAKVKEVMATHGAHIEAIERYLGVPAGTLYRADARAVKSWIAALRSADHVGKQDD